MEYVAYQISNRIEPNSGSTLENTYQIMILRSVMGFQDKDIASFAT